MPDFVINKKYEQDIIDLINKFPIKTLGTVLKRGTRNKHLYLYLLSKYSQLENKSITEYLYWLVNDLHDFPKCKKCNKPVTSFINFNNGYHEYCSLKCSTNSKEVQEKQKQIWLRNYGTEYHFQSHLIKDKIKQTCISHFGKEYAFQSDSVKNKIKETSLNRYGTDHPFRNQKIQKKFKLTMFQKYGCEYTRQNKDLNLKCIKTNLKNYGTENPMQNSDIVLKNKRTCLERYGYPNVFQSEEIQEKQRRTCLERYGCISASSKYFYDEKYFDSLPELLYYIWLKDNNINFRYHDGTYFIYKDENDAVHKYYPDFILTDNNQAVEIKGGHFFLKGIDTLYNPYSKKYENSKFKCMREHNVRIIRDDSSEMKLIREIVVKKYGLRYLKNFQIQNRFIKEKKLNKNKM